jgi:hypothetical protein
MRRYSLNPLRTRGMERSKKKEPPIWKLNKLHSKKLRRRAEPSRLLDVNGVEPSRVDTGFFRTKLSRAEFSEVSNRGAVSGPMARAGFGIPDMYAACQLSAEQNKNSVVKDGIVAESLRKHSERPICPRRDCSSRNTPNATLCTHPERIHAYT